MVLTSIVLFLYSNFVHQLKFRHFHDLPCKPRVHIPFKKFEWNCRFYVNIHTTLAMFHPVLIIAYWREDLIS